MLHSAAQRLVLRGDTITQTIRDAIKLLEFSRHGNNQL